MRVHEAGGGGETHELHPPAPRAVHIGRQNEIHLPQLEELACRIHNAGGEVRICMGTWAGLQAWALHDAGVARIHSDDDPDEGRAILPAQRPHLGGVARRDSGDGGRATRRRQHGVHHDEGARGGRTGLLPARPRAGGRRHSPQRLVDLVPLVLGGGRNDAGDLVKRHQGGKFLA